MRYRHLYIIFIILIFCLCSCNFKTDNLNAVSSTEYLNSDVSMPQSSSVSSGSESDNASSQDITSAEPNSPSREPTEWEFTDGTRKIEPTTVHLGDSFLGWTLEHLNAIESGTEVWQAYFSGSITVKGTVICGERYPFAYAILFYPDDDSIFPRIVQDSRDVGIWCELRYDVNGGTINNMSRDDYMESNRKMVEMFGLAEQEECMFQCELVLSGYEANVQPSAVVDVALVSAINGMGKKDLVVSEEESNE